MCGHVHRALALLAGALAVGPALAPLARADVTMTPDEAAPGSIAKLDFTVSTDRADATTTKVEVHLPAGRTFGTLAAATKYGWSATLVRTPTAPTPGPTGAPAVGEEVTAVTWTALSDAAAIGPGQFDVFSLRIGPLPGDVDRLAFYTVQTFSDGQAISWTEPGTPGAAGAHPAPGLTLRPSAAPVPTGTPTPAAAAAAAAPVIEPPFAAPIATPVAVTASAPRKHHPTATQVTVGLCLGGVLIGLGVAGAAWLRRRSPL